MATKAYVHNESHPALQLRDHTGQQCRGDLALIRTSPTGTRGLLKSFAPDNLSDRDMIEAYEYLAKQRNDWMRNGPPEYFNSQYEITSLERWHNPK